MANDEVFLGRTTERDYFTLKGIENKLGIERENLVNFVIGELIDNSIDDLEKNSTKDPHVWIKISREDIKPANVPYSRTFLKIIVRNSVNPGSEYVFTKEHLDSIYKFGSYYSSKRILRITKGALGDASKLILGAPYALADYLNFDLSCQLTKIYPIALKTSGKNRLKTFHVSMPIIDLDSRPEITEGGETISKETYTEVQLLLPYYDNKEYSTEYAAIQFVKEYTILNTHIGFTIDTPIYKRDLPATQKMTNSGKNLSNPHFYNLPEFREMIREIKDKDDTFHSVFQKTFRGAHQLPKNDLTQTTIKELTTEKAEQLFALCKEKVPAISEDPKIGFASMIPFDTAKRVRKRAIEERLSQLGINCNGVKYKQKFGYYKSGNGEKYPFFFEAFVGHDKSKLPILDVIQSINSKVSQNPVVFGVRNYYYKTDKSKHPANSIFDILNHYGYSFDEEKCRKPNNIILLNLISPKVNYESHSKGWIDHAPFRDLIVETISAACKGGSDKDDRRDKIEALREVLKDRKEKYLALQDPLERERQQWTQSDVFYATRYILVNEFGYKDSEIDRDTVTAAIREECDKLNVTREELGIIAADRAQLYFNRNWHDVGLNELDTLVGYGSDMVIIEKEGIIVQVNAFSDDKRIALLNTRGFAVEYASKLAELASKKHCNISIIVDWDASGLLIYLKLKEKIPGIKRIGVDPRTVRKMGLREEDVQESYTPTRHYKSLVKTLDGLFERAYLVGDTPDNYKEYAYIANHIEDLRDTRIEINSITFKLNDNYRFWMWIEDELRTAFPNRDFTRSFKIPEYVKPKALEELEDIIEEKGKKVLTPQTNNLKDKLSDNKIKNAFLFDRTNRMISGYNADTYQVALTDQSRLIIENNADLKSDIKEIKKLVNRLRDERLNASAKVE